MDLVYTITRCIPPLFWNLLRWSWHLPLDVQIQNCGVTQFFNMHLKVLVESGSHVPLTFVCLWGLCCRGNYKGSVWITIKTVYFDPSLCFKNKNNLCICFKELLLDILQLVGSVNSCFGEQSKRKWVFYILFIFDTFLCKHA